jgi:hypothetical protein
MFASYRSLLTRGVAAALVMTAARGAWAQAAPTTVTFTGRSWKHFEHRRHPCERGCGVDVRHRARRRRYERRPGFPRALRR